HLSHDTRRFSEAVAAYDVVLGESTLTADERMTLAFERLLAAASQSIPEGIATNDEGKRVELFNAMLELEKQFPGYDLEIGYRIAVLQYLMDKPDATRLKSLVAKVELTGADDGHVAIYGTVLHIAAVGFRDLAMQKDYLATRDLLVQFDLNYGTNFEG